MIGNKKKNIMKKFLSWWKVWGQVWGFISLVGINTLILTSDYMNQYDWAGILFLITFFGGTSWYIWQMQLHGWELPKDIKDTH